MHVVCMCECMYGVCVCVRAHVTLYMDICVWIFLPSLLVLILSLLLKFDALLTVNSAMTWRSKPAGFRWLCPYVCPISFAINPGFRQFHSFRHLQLVAFKVIISCY